MRLTLAFFPTARLPQSLFTPKLQSIFRRSPTKNVHQLCAPVFWPKYFKNKTQKLNIQKLITTDTGHRRVDAVHGYWLICVQYPLLLSPCQLHRHLPLRPSPAQQPLLLVRFVQFPYCHTIEYQLVLGIFGYILMILFETFAVVVKWQKPNIFPLSQFDHNAGQFKTEKPSAYSVHQLYSRAGTRCWVVCNVRTCVFRHALQVSADFCFCFSRVRRPVEEWLARHNPQKLKVHYSGTAATRSTATKRLLGRLMTRAVWFFVKVLYIWKKGLGENWWGW